MNNLLQMVNLSKKPYSRPKYFYLWRLTMKSVIIRMKKTMLLMMLGALLTSAVVAAPVVRIKGKVVEVGSNTPIDYADVLLFVKGESSSFMHTIPDTEGFFMFSDVKAGEYSVMVRAMGFDIYTQADITLSASAVVDLGVVAMNPLEQGLAEVEIVAQRKQIIYKLDKKVIEASGNLLASGGTAVDILENTPSIRVDAEGEVTFRGSSGFAVYVDGKPSIFSGSQALQQIPSGQIENIEIITTPSARHDTGGDVGIINIITKKDSQQGLSGMVNVSGSTVLTRSVNYLLSWQQKRSRWHFGGNWTDKMMRSHFDQDKISIINDLETHSHSNGIRKSNNFDYSLKGGWQYTLPKTTFSAELEGGFAGRYRIGDLDYSEEHSGAAAPNIGLQDYFSRDFYKNDQIYLQGTVGADHKFNDKGHQITSLFLVKYAGNALEYFQSDLFDKEVDRSQLGDARQVYRDANKNYQATEKKDIFVEDRQQNTYADQHRLMGHRAYEDEFHWTIQANIDYVYPYSSTGRLEAGYQYFSYLEDGDYSMEFWIPEKNQFEFRKDDKIYDNFFYFQHGINSFYGILGDSYKAFNYQLGLRAEHTHRVLRSDVPNANRMYNNLHFFPSVHLGFNLPNEQQLMASYSRRITRPVLYYMEPYITYRDFYSAEIGNPDIQNEFINSFEMNYKKNIGTNTVAATVFHRTRHNKIERLRIPYEGAIRAGVTLDSMANVGNDYSTGMELNTQIQATRWWNINMNGSMYYYRVVNKLQRSNKDETSTNYDISLNNGFDLGKTTRFQLDGNFVGPSVTTQGRTNSFWYVNLALRQQLFNRKLNTTLAMRDVFNSARYVSNITTADLQSLTRIRPSYPLITLTLSYTFNNYKVKATQSKDDRNLFEGTNH
jgi:outer membrane cobalamin receptor